MTDTPEDIIAGTLYYWGLEYPNTLTATILSALAAAGYVIVPKVPTMDMLSAFCDAETGEETARARYAALLFAAAPPREPSSARGE